jgi:uncharacterized protein (DUF885 family)
MEILERFHQIVNDEWEYRLKFDPLFATLAGDRRYNDRLAHITPADWEDHLNVLKGFQQRLEAIESHTLPDAEQVNYALFHRMLDDAIREDEYGAYFLPLSKTGGMHMDFPELFNYMPLESLADYENYLARLNDFHRYTRELIELLKEGLRRGYYPPAYSQEGVLESIEMQIVSTAEDSPLYQPFKTFPDSFTAAEQESLVSAAQAAILGSVVPAFRELGAWIQETYEPACRSSIAAVDLPDGRAFYAHRVRMYTTLDLSPEQVHATGLDEVKRIRGEMLDLVEQAGFKSDFTGFIEFLRSDKRFYATSAEGLLAHTALVLKRIEGELPRLFKTLPRSPYGIREIPAYSAPGNTTAYYFPPAGDGSRAGFYYVNTYDLPSRPLYEIEALSLHEAVPGHHLQIALQQELGELPNFRRFYDATAYIEGWALYAERLGLELGFYRDPYSNFGRLSYEMWRACRLVVDTGMHALGWTRQQAIDFMAENTSSTLLNIINEVDRYIFWPGQALAYKIGELKIRQLRTRAEAALGERFDVRLFHDLLLGSGAVPLDLLDKMVEVWIQNK